MNCINLVLAAALFMASCNEGKSDATKNESAKKESKKPLTKYPPGDKVFFPTGELQMAGKTTGGKRNGLWSSWYKSGKRNSEAYFQNDQMQGDYRVWYENGQLRIEGEYKNDLEIGTWYFYGEKGDTLKVVDFDKVNGAKK